MVQVELIQQICIQPSYMRWKILRPVRIVASFIVHVHTWGAIKSRNVEVFYFSRVLQNPVVAKVHNPVFVSVVLVLTRWISSSTMRSKTTV